MILYTSLTDHRISPRLRQGLLNASLTSPLADPERNALTSFLFTLYQLSPPPKKVS
ncbi:hypothetical protein WN55_10112 [Dufourea novaeangliae]|uniref:Uncharacterized protein n=1 Tax=Dufourea novaeangliae TaxID=178035 RepID=A0A154P2Z4_DUFNO|nr:hypothetical protein WN55_10112 [Dufourea novaeangliae]